MAEENQQAVAAALTPEQEQVRAIFAKLLPRREFWDPLPPPQQPTPGIPHAPRRTPNLSPEKFRLAVRNALRYFPAHLHAELAPEFARELREEGHIYMRRFRPTEYAIRAYPVQVYPARLRQAACIQLMIMNNLDSEVAQFPEELITYGGQGSVLSNWAQYHLLMHYLSTMTESQTLSMYSGHPAGLFPSSPEAPRVVITNGMVIPNHSRPADYDRMYALGCTIYGQMTAGSYCYIGPQGIVHGTTLTILNAARKYLGEPDMTGRVYVSSGLGGMSGAQPKAGNVCNGISVTAEVDRAALEKRLRQGWVDEVVDTVEQAIQRIRECRAAKQARAIAFHGNVVALWEGLAALADTEKLVDLGSDQTSLHNPFNGGYYPVQLGFDEANRVMAEDPARFKALVRESLRRQVAAINRLCSAAPPGERPMHFWDYGNAFLLEAARAGADILKPEVKDAEGQNQVQAVQAQAEEEAKQAEEAAAGATYDPRAFRYPSYVQDFMGDCFSLGFGPFRWVCTSGKPEDLRLTDQLAAQVIRELQAAAPDAAVRGQYADNLLWIEQAEAHGLVVGSQARILYSDAEGRCALARAFNAAVRDGRLAGPVVLSRDHHDVSGTDSPFRETSNVYDGSAFTADMAVQNAVGDAFRGATWVALHNGGGVGWGEVINGGFGLVLDGSDEAERRSQQMLFWDVNNGVGRRCWSGNANANKAIRRAMELTPDLKVTLPEPADEDLVARACAQVEE